MTAGGGEALVRGGDWRRCEGGGVGKRWVGDNGKLT